MEDQTKALALPILCTVCGAQSRGWIYGGMACEACKVFFKRNAENELNIRQCRFNGHCEINIHTRHLCTYCRLMKCFANGMQRELLRCSLSTTMKKSLARRSALIPTLNLLQADQSTLTVNQWNLLSNLSHCFDDSIGLSTGEQYMSEQSHLPHKMRFKSASIIRLYQMTLAAVQSLYKNNGDFLSLCTEDRSILLYNTLPHTGSLSSNYIASKIRLKDYPAYYEAVEMMAGAKAALLSKRLSTRLHFDLITMKLLLSILCFSTIRCTGYWKNSSANLSNIQEILRIQDAYIELTWRYLLYRYGHKQAVKCFLEFIRCVLIINEGIILSYDIHWFSKTIDSVTRKTEESLSLLYSLHANEVLLQS